MAGRPICLMGPSGSSKDSLSQAAREPPALHGCRIMRRMITRSAETVGEGAQAMTPTQFDTLERVSVFAMNWRTNDLCYNIPMQIDEQLAQGYDVLVNGSHDYLARARRRYPNLLTVLPGVKPEVLHQRLLARDRESPEEIEARLTRNTEFTASLKGPLFQLDDSGDLGGTLRSLLAHLDSNRTCA